jgi:hypothetical protein
MTAKMFAGHCVVLGHARFTVEMESLDDLVLLNIDNGLRFTTLVGNVKLVEGSSIGTAIRFGLGRKLLDDLSTARMTMSGRSACICRTRSSSQSFPSYAPK